MIIKITIIGTLKNIPDIPQSFPMTDKKIKRIIGLMFSALPINLFSKKFPINKRLRKSKAKIIIENIKLKLSTTEKITGNNIENKETK